MRGGTYPGLFGLSLFRRRADGAGDKEKAHRGKCLVGVDAEAGVTCPQAEESQDSQQPAEEWRKACADCPETLEAAQPCPHLDFSALASVTISTPACGMCHGSPRRPGQPGKGGDSLSPTHLFLGKLWNLRKSQQSRFPKCAHQDRCGEARV